MSKAPFMTVEFKVEQSDVQFAADCIVDNFFEGYNAETTEAVGIVYMDLVKEIMDMHEFSVMVRKGVEKYGPDAINDPFDYMDFAIVERTPGFQKLHEVCQLLDEIIDDADRNDRDFKSNACEDAIATLKRAGFKIVKA